MKKRTDFQKPMSLKIESRTSVYLPGYKKYFEFDFDVKLSSGINLQRELCWTDFQKEQLILSLIKEIEIPPVLLFIDVKYRDHPTYLVIDGKQRLTTILGYINGEFPVYDLNNYAIFYRHLHPHLQSKAFNWITANMVYYDSLVQGTMKDKDLIELFEYTNFLGTPQDKQHLDSIKKTLIKK
ncbi:MAG: DUF262 domain-containing protein [Fusobacteriaceae bacterium]